MHGPASARGAVAATKNSNSNSSQCIDQQQHPRSSHHVPQLILSHSNTPIDSVNLALSQRLPPAACKPANQWLSGSSVSPVAGWADGVRTRRGYTGTGRDYTGMGRDYTGMYGEAWMRSCRPTSLTLYLLPRSLWRSHSPLSRIKAAPHNRP